jgi:hypothetical protein
MDSEEGVDMGYHIHMAGVLVVRAMKMRDVVYGIAWTLVNVILPAIAGGLLSVAIMEMLR